MRRSATSLVIVGVVAVLTVHVRAELIEFQFNGTVESLNGFIQVPPRWAKVTVGDSWSLKYTFDSTTLTGSTDPTIAGYEWAMMSYTLRVGNVYLTSRSPNPGLIEVHNNWPSSEPYDSYTVATELSDESWISLYLGGPATIGIPLHFHFVETSS